MSLCLEAAETPRMRSVKFLRRKYQAPSEMLWDSWGIQAGLAGVAQYLQEAHAHLERQLEAKQAVAG